MSPPGAGLSSAGRLWEAASAFSRIVAKLVLLATLFGPILPAQDAFPLREVEFEGNQNFAEEDLLAVTGLELGERVRKSDFDLAMRRLSEAGVFESLSYRFGPKADGYKLTVVVQEVPELFPVRLVGFDESEAVLAALLKQSLPLYAGLVPGGGPMVRMIVNTLQVRWREQGGNEEVVADIAPSGDGGFEMVIGPERQTSNIAFTRFHNTGEINALELQRIFNHSAIGEPYSEARFKELLHYNARPVFTERGFMGVAFCPCQAQPDPDTEGLLVDVQVEPGEAYLFGDVIWPEPLPIAPETFRKVNRIGSGQVANMKAAYDTMAGISEGAKRHGYMKAQATFEERVDHDQRRVHLEIEIALGKQYVFSRLIVSGLDILSEPAVRKRWGMNQGDPFDVRYPAYFLDRVKADAMFENLKRTSWNLDVDEVSGRVDVTLVFSGMEETPEARHTGEIASPF